MIYLDNAATSWPKPECVYQKTDEALRAGGSPGRGGHQMARNAAEIVFEAREALSELLNAPASTQVAFVQNATEGLNTALFGLINPGDVVVTTSMEHNAVVRPLYQLKTYGVEVRCVSCNSAGELDWQALQDALRGARWLVMTHASNVSGVCFPIHEIGRLAAKQGVSCIIDACQTMGFAEVNVEDGKFAAVAFSGHKSLLGPQGSGGLYLAEGLVCRPLHYGGTGSVSESEEQPGFMPDRLESGTPNVPAIAGMLEGVRHIKTIGMKNVASKEMKLAEILRLGIMDLPGVRLLGSAKAKEQTPVVSFAVEHADCGEVARRLEETKGIACRSGLHCAPWAHRTLGSLQSGAIRFSPGLYNTEQEMVDAIVALKHILRSI